MHLTLSLLLQSFADGFIRREILNLTVTCLHKDGGCDWRGSLRAAEVSISWIKYVHVQCMSCTPYTYIVYLYLNLSLFLTLI